ncbi:MAG: ABC transporter permease [Bacteroidales bacterium]
MVKSQRYIYNLNIALDAVFANKFRSMLTALGIIFGVGAVIAMLAIGSGARQEILDQMKLVGVNNIIIRPVFPDDDAQQELWEGRFSPGLTLNDANSIKEIIPSVSRVSPELEISTFGFHQGVRRPVRITGVNPEHFDLFGLNVVYGTSFTGDMIDNGTPVCVISNQVRGVFFGNTNPVGKQLKVGNNWLTVLGVVEDRLTGDQAAEKLGISEYGSLVYVPVQTVLVRYLDRSAVSIKDIEQERTRSGRRGRGFVIRGDNNGEDDQEPRKSYHQLDRIVVQVENSELLTPTSELIQRMLLRRHYGVEDFEIIVPELLLQQEQRAKDIFNIVLGAIAAISLLVGGIGIMNIMLASVMERTREIGIRLAIGAKKTDVIFQFLSESIFISVSGGIIGIFLGIAISRAIMQFTDILTIVSLASVLISFTVSAGIGIIFGYMPARKAAQKDPVTSLRYE